MFLQAPTKSKKFPTMNAFSVGLNSRSDPSLVSNQKYQQNLSPQKSCRPFGRLSVFIGSQELSAQNARAPKKYGSYIICHNYADYRNRSVMSCMTSVVVVIRTLHAMPTPSESESDGDVFFAFHFFLK